MAGSSVTEKVSQVQRESVAASDENHNLVLPDPAADPSDDSPTIISKTPPTQIKRRDENDIDGIRGRSLAHFELIESIGVGGMAAVLRARDKQLDRFVALKILPPEMAGDAENVRRFHEEARAAARLDHENIARVFYYAEDQGLHFIAFEFVEGKNVRQLLDDRGGPLPVAEALHYILQIACGLEHASSRGVVHRDIKPSNIIITPTGRAKLVDMGLARRIGRPEEGALTHSGVTLGTFDYISPEQALEPREADTRSDIYSLGCTFYHMVTGQAPVPDGTAAKKLHHHQHVAPLDPRELNPEVPHEVAAILARMMHKDPRGRYQTPRHLVQHLLQVAQLLGTSPDMPNDVLFVDAPLPTPPQKRPLLLLSLAAVLLGAFLVALSLAPRLQTPTLTSSGDAKAPVVLKEKEKTPRDVPELHLSSVRGVTDEAELRKALADATVKRIVLKNGFREPILQPLLANMDERRELTIEPDNENEPVKIAITRPADPRQIWAGLIVEGTGAVTLRNLHFVLNSLQTTPEKGVVAAVALRGTGKLTVEKCTFHQENAPSDIPKDNDRFPISSVVVEGAVNRQSKQPWLVLDRCFFREGQVAISLLGAAVVRPSDCAFGPHAALFNLKSDTLEPRSKLELTNCSAFVVRGPAFRLDDNATCVLHTRHCIFSSPGADAGANQHPSLILQTDTIAPAVVYYGDRNCYHNLNVYWGRQKATNEKVVSWDLFGAFIRKNGGADNDSAELPDIVNPFAVAAPLKDLEQIKAGEDADAFRVNAELAQVREADAAKDPIRHVIPLGITWATKPGSLAVLASKQVELAKNQLLVNPDAKEAPGIYNTVDKAIGNAKNGDEILIMQGKAGRHLELQPVNIRAGIDLIIKPYSAEHRPILTMAAIPGTLDASVNLLTIEDSKIEVQDLELMLEPNPKLSAAGMVELKGNGQCTFRRCVLTLKAAESVALYAAALREAKLVMKMANTSNPRSAPVLEFIDTFVRGEGDLLNVPASRPFELTVTNSLVALSRSLLRMHGIDSEKDSGDAVASIHMDRASVFVGESMLNLHGSSEGKGLVLTRVDPVQDCLFVSVRPRTPLIALQEIQVNEENLTDVVKWNGGVNSYSGFDDVYLRHSRTDIFPMTVGREAWKRFSGESASQFVQAKFATALGERPYSQSTFADFQVSAAFKELLQNFGTKLTENDLPPLRSTISDGQ